MSPRLGSRAAALGLLRGGFIGRRLGGPLVVPRRSAETFAEVPETLPAASAYHTPVMGLECVDWLVTEEDGFYVDGTLGGGGHSSLILERLGARGRLVGVDRDAAAIETAGARLGGDARFSSVHANFDEGIATAVADAGRLADGVLLDLGVSSRQLDDAARGFSFRGDGPVDMRMDGRSQTTAGDLINVLSERDLAFLLRANADEPHASRIAKAVIANRPFERTTDLAQTVAGAVPRLKRSAPAAHENNQKRAVARCFQALRVKVNDEFGALERCLLGLPGLVKPGGRVVVLTYHSLEDRRVKRVFRTGKLRGDAPSDDFGNKLAPFAPLARKALPPSEREVALNPRARSAKLRCAERTPY